MAKKIILEQSKPALKLLILASLALLGIGIFSILSIILATTIYQVPILSNPGILKDTSNPAVLPALKMMQIMQACVFQHRLRTNRTPLSPAS